MQFVIYHAAWLPDHVEDNPADPVGIDSLIKALDDCHVPPNSSVWADIATTWRVLLTDPTQGAHALGKLLKRLGTRRVVWGTDSVVRPTANPDHGVPRLPHLGRVPEALLLPDTDR